MHIKNDENFGRLLSWNNKNTTNFFEDHCGEIYGSAGEFYPMNSKRDHITMYSSEMCTNQKLEYIEDVTIKGIKAFKYGFPNVFDNGHVNPENQCYCSGECMPAGVLNLTACRDNTPIFLSLPHFYGADPIYTESIDGMEPSKEKHEFYMTLEPVTI